MLLSGKAFFISALNLEMLLSRARFKGKPWRMPVVCSWRVLDAPFESCRCRDGSSQWINRCWVSLASGHSRQLVTVTCSLPPSVTLVTESQTCCTCTNIPFLLCHFGSSFDLDPTFSEANLKRLFSTQKRLDVNKNYVSLGRSEAIAQVLSAHKRVEACEVTDLSLASLTFKKGLGFLQNARPFENWP